MSLLVFWILFLIIRFHVIKGQECSTDSDCNSLGRIRCGFCIDGKCNFPFEKIFLPNKNCEFVTDNCKKQACNRKTTMFQLEGYGNCVCECFSGNYGQYCGEIGNRVTYASGIQLIAPTYIEYLEPYPVFITVLNQGAKLNLTMLLTTTSGLFMASVSEPNLYKLTPKSAQDYCRQRSPDMNVCPYFFSRITGERLLYDIPLEMPFWYPDNWKWDKKREISTAGLTHTLVLTIIQEGLKLYTLDQQLVVNYPKNQRDIPLPRIYNCGKSFEARVLFTKNQEIYLTSEVYFANIVPGTQNLTLKQDPNRQSEVQYKWMAFRVGKKLQLLNPDFMYVGKSFWKVAPYSWKHGNYIVRLETPTFEKKRNYAQCYLQVVLKPLIALILGSSQVFVSSNVDFVLDPSMSVDPNQPADKQKLRFTVTCNWTLESICTSHERYSSNVVEGLPKIRFTYSSQYYELKPDQVYNFTLKVESLVHEYQLQPAYAHQIVTVVSLRDVINVEHINLQCVYNCEIETNPQDIVYLQVYGLEKILIKLHFEWTVLIEKEVQDISNIRQEDTPSYIFIVLKNSLKEKTTYQFKAALILSTPSKDFNTGTAMYELRTSTSPNTTCGIEPTKGIAGETPFRISCRSSGPVSYEFYDKNGQDGPDFSGRMLGSNENGEIDNVLLTRGELEIFTSVESGMKTVTKLDVELSESNLTEVQIDRMLSDLKDMSGRGNLASSLHSASIISDVLKPEMQRDDILEDLLTFLSKVQLETLTDAKLCTSTLHIVLMAMFRQEFNITFNGAYHATLTLDSIIQTLIRGGGTHEDRRFTFNVMYQVFSQLLDCVYILLEVEKQGIPGPLQYIDPNIRLQVTEISKIVMKNLYKIAHMLLRKHLPAQKHKIIESSVGETFIFVKVDTPLALSNHTIQGRETLSSLNSVVIPHELAQSIEDRNFYMGLQMIILSHEPVWWQKIMDTKTIGVYICYQYYANGKCRIPKRFKFPLHIVFNNSEFHAKIEFRNESATQLDILMPRDQLDLKVMVIRIEAPTKASLHVVFKFQADSKGLKVLVKKGRRPDYDSVYNEGLLMTADNPEYNVDYHPDEKIKYYYMAMLPDAPVPLGEEVHFQYKIYYKLCLNWQGRWTAAGCSVKVNPDDQGPFICECLQGSLFAAEVNEPRFMLNPAQEFHYSITRFSFKTRGLVGVVLLASVFLVCFIWAWRMEKHDKVKRYAVVLADNFPGEMYGYLVCVVTGARIRAGTKANIGIQIYGTLGDSRAHVLSSDKYNITEGMGEDWFLVYTHEHLGILQGLYIWHDHTSDSPSWFCDSILIFDVAVKEFYVFLVEEWIPVGANNFPEAIVSPVKLAALTNWYRVFKDHLKAGFHLSHLWLSTVIRHPRDPVSRTERLGIILCFILVSMLTSVVFMMPTGEIIEIDDPSYVITWKEVRISFISFVASSTVAFLLMSMFRKSYNIWYCYQEETKTEDEEYCKSVKYVTLEKDIINDLENPHYLSYRYSNTNIPRGSSILGQITLKLMPKPLIPVQLPGDESVIDINWVWRIAAVCSCLFIVLECGYLNILWSREIGPNKSKKWFTVILFTVIEHAFIFLPLKIFIVSLVLALACQRLIYRDFYTFNPIDGCQLDLVGNVSHLMNIVRKRKTYKYYPIPETFQEKCRQTRIKIAKWSKILELLMMLVFLVVISKLLSTSILFQYYSNSHFHSMLNLSPTKFSSNYRSISNRTQFEDFLQQTLRSILFKYVWYNLDPIYEADNKQHREDWLFDAVSRIVGIIRIRQFRVMPGYCSIPEVLQNHSVRQFCAAPWGSGAEDTWDYHTYWMRGRGIFNDSYVPQQSVVNWTYISASDHDDFYYYGETGHGYPPGGYVWDLGANNYDMMVRSVYMQNLWWVGHCTRAVLVHILVYNVNTHCFSEIVLLTEQTVSGEFLPTLLVQSINILKIELNFWMILLIIFAILFCVRVCTIINNAGLVGFFKKGYRLHELLLLISVLTSLMYFLLLHLTTEPYIRRFHIYQVEARCMDYYDMARYFFAAKHLLCIVLVLAVTRVFVLWRFGRTFFNYFYTFTHSLRCVLWLTLIFILFLIILWRFLGFLLNVFIAVVLNQNLFFRTNQSHSFQINLFLWSKMLRFLTYFGSVLTMRLIFAITLYEYKRAKSYNIKDWNIFNYIKFIIEETTISFTENAYEMKSNQRHRIGTLINWHTRSLTNILIKNNHLDIV